MFTQFQVRYPTGSLISELLTIYQGKFVVRVLAQVDGVTRATGMAAAESILTAEDQARNRALMVLGLQPDASIETNAAQTISLQVKIPQVETEQPHPAIQLGQISPSTTTDDLGDVSSSASTSAPAKSASHPDSTDAEKSDANSQEYAPESDLSIPVQLDDQIENYGESQEQTDSKGTTFQDVTPLIPRSYQEDLFEQKPSEPIDLSDAIARTTVELKRLGWSNQKGREYLVKTYNKRSRQELTDAEMLEFLHYLESLES